MLRHILFATYLLVIQLSFAQNSHTLINTGEVFAHKVYGNYAYLMVGGDNAYRSNLYRMQLPDGKLELLDSAIQFCQSVLPGDSGLFYISFNWSPNGNDGEHILNFMPAGGTQKRVLKMVNQFVEHPYRTRPHMAKLINGKYHINTWFSSRNSIWESDGTVDGTRIVFQNLSEIKDYSLYQDKPIAILYNGNKDFIVNHQYKMLSPDYAPNNRNSLRFFYNSNTTCIYSIYNKLYICGQVDKVDSAALKINGFRTFSTIQSNDSVLQGYNYVGNKLYTYSLRIMAPYSYDSIAPSSAIQAMEYPRIDLSNSRFMSLWSFSTGYEMAFAPLDDSMRIIKDLNPGHASSVASYTYPYKQLMEVDGVAYFGANNGSDGKGYLYSSDGRYIKSHFPWGYAYGILKGLFIKDSLYYWTRYNDDSTFIYWRSLNRRDTQADPQKKVNDIHKGGEWLRTVAPVISTAPYTLNYSYMQSHAVQSDKDGNVIVCGIARDLGPYYYLRFSDTNTIQQMQGDQMVIKYDSTGRLIWSKTIGGINAWTSLNPAFHTDKSGDVLVFSNYFQKAWFDSVELNTPRAAIYLCKLNGKNGNVKWVKQFNPAYYSNDNSSDNVISDRDGNIYLSFTFKNFSADFDNRQIQTDRSPANGIVKLDPEGNVLWAKGNETPWTDKYGISRDMQYDSASNSIYNLIGQGFYNWSASCRYAPFRSILYKISPEGDVQALQSLEGNDLNAASIAEITENNSVFISGFYRSSMHLPPYSASSPVDKSAGCNRWEQFYSTIKKDNGNPLSLQSTRNDVFFPFDACSDAQFIYVLGSQKDPASSSSNRHILSIRRYTHLGRYAGKRLLRDCRTGNPFDFNFYFNIHLSGAHFLVSMNTNSKITPFNNFVEQYEGLSVYRLLKDKEWTDASNYYEHLPESGIVVAPNPASEHISLQFTDPENYNRLDVYDALGRLVKTVFLIGENYQHIALDGLTAGVYTLHFSGRGSHKEKLVIR